MEKVCEWIEVERWERWENSEVARSERWELNEVAIWNSGRVVSREGGMKFIGKTVFYCSRGAEMRGSMVKCGARPLEGEGGGCEISVRLPMNDGAMETVEYMWVGRYLVHARLDY